MTASKPQKKTITLTHPELVKEWDYEKNVPLIPDDVTHGSNRKVWWKCSICGYEWSCSVYNRAKGQNCPICGLEKRTVNRIKSRIANVGSLSDTSPELVQEWDCEKNHPLTPNDVTRGSDKKVWWKCSKGHSWETKISGRAVSGTGCPYCANKRVLVGYNDLETLFSSIALEWDYEKNSPVTPRDVVSGSNKRFWWKCNKGHEWKTSVNDRTQGGRCPACAKENRKIQFAKTVLKRSGSLIEVYPELAREWHPTKNGDLKPSEITSNSGQKVWWLCPVCKNAWEDNPGHRTHGRGCPFCSNHRVMVGTNDLQTVNPELAKEWHPTKNGCLSPSDVLSQSNKRVWWICSKCGNEWSAQISNRKDRG